MLDPRSNVLANLYWILPPLWDRRVVGATLFLYLLAALVSGAVHAEVDLAQMHERTAGTLQEMKSHQAEDVLECIAEAVDSFNLVARHMLSAPPGEEDQYLDELIAFYEETAARFRNVDKNSKDVLKEIDERGSELGDIMRAARGERDRVRAEILTLNSVPLATDPDMQLAERQQRESLRRLYEQQLATLRVWIEKYDRILESGGDIRVAVKRLLHVLQLSIPIYEQSAITLRMNRDLRDAQYLFEAPGQIQSLTNDVIATWTATEDMISKALEDLESAGQTIP
ncbi:hypothetical protein ACFL6M_03630 [Candidatus Eisenbacteria bacterium]|uniref:Uncharacterized protein n=1 Tax=Eiseniibacteriota bacterium TaxID=2212470 RepID=A0ABV6YKK5_UNCEI